MGDVQSVLGVGAILGEGPIWFGDAVWFVDIKGRRVHRFVPGSGAAQQWDMPGEVGWVLPAATGGMLIGLQTGLYRFDPQSGATRLLHNPEPSLAGNRLNDATVDRSGRLWFGSMDNAEAAATGRVYRCADGACLDTGLASVVITNGPAVSVDGTMLYHVDTLRQTIWRVPVREDASLGTPVRHVTIEKGGGYPDGPTIDSEGHLWIGLFGGWGVRRYDPTGRLVETVRFPVANVTKLAFGGPGLRTAYATTAHKGLSAAERATQPQAGDLFAFDPGVAGIKVTAANI